MTSWITFHSFFEIVCFALLVSYLGKLFLQYGVGLIQDGIKAEEDELADLNKQYCCLKQKKDAIASVTATKREYAKVLLKRIKKWSSIQDKRYEDNVLERKAAAKRLKKYLKTQNESAVLEHTRNSVIPNAIDEAYVTLAKKFESEKHKQAFLEHVIATLEEQE